MENTISVERSSETHRLVCVNTSKGASRLLVYRHDSPSEGTSQQPRIKVLPPSGGNPTLGADRLHEVVRMHIQTRIEANKISVKCKYGQNWLYELSLMDSCG